MKNLTDRLRKIELVIFDVDGVLTDDTIFIGQNGAEFKRFNIADGLGIFIAKKYGLKIAFSSGRQSSATQARAKELGIIDIHQGTADKIDFYNQLKSKYNLDDENIAFVGNDLTDVNVMRQCGLAFTVPVSPSIVLKSADFITKKSGGAGVAREVLDMILDARGIDEEKRLP
ncbi:MAG: 3-deoxy-D-manno-octulosonate 8-phosphate phosphatase [Candidatus Zixiibacteriota bacterium]|nr:MAG: 3-deoxy-D-manno-octulosonate 8-phosphate phosphatase [candidate division Zixibacteria bacterium]